MKTKRILFFALLPLLIITTLAFNIQATKANGEISFSLEPVAILPLTDINVSANGLETPPTPPPVGQNFTVEIHVRNATVENAPTGIAGVEVHFYFGNILTYAVPTGFISCLGADGGVLIVPILHALGPDFFDADGNRVITPPYVGAIGFRVAAATTGGAWNGADGIVAKIAFRIIKQPLVINGEPTAYLPLEIGFTDLVCMPEPFSIPLSMPTTEFDGCLTIDNDHKTSQGLGYDYPINVNVTNDPEPILTFNVTAFANTTAVASENVTLPFGSSTILQLHWNTTGYEYGNYEITFSIFAYPVPGETTPPNSTYVYAWLVLTIPGSLDGNLFVNLVDLVLLANAYGSKPGEVKWNPNADVNGNTLVDLPDLVILAIHYNQHFP